MSESLVFPQLASGAVTCLPLRRTSFARTTVNELPGGAQVLLADPASLTATWELRFVMLSDEERSTLEAFFESCEGRLRIFTFCDPTGNLLTWSESLHKSNWQTSPLVSLTSDEAGVTRLTNAAQVPGHVEQHVNVPSSYQVSFAAEIKSDEPCSIEMIFNGAQTGFASSFRVTKSWQLFWVSGQVDGSRGGMFSIQLEPGVTIDIRRIRVCPQAGPGAYRRTYESSGIFPSARFDQDELLVASEGPHLHSASIRVRAQLKS